MQQYTFRILSGDYFEFVLLPLLIDNIENNDLQVRFNLNQIIGESPKQLIHAQADVMLDAFPIDVPLIPLYMMWSKAFDHDPANKWLLNQLREVNKRHDEER